MISEQKYVDLNDLDQPLKTLYTDEFFHSFESELYDRQYYYSLEKNEVNLDDNWWNSIFDPPTITFNSLKFFRHQTTKLEQYDKEIKIIFLKGARTNQYGRKVLSVFEVTGLIGGIFELLDIVIGTLIGFAYSFAFKIELK